MTSAVIWVKVSSNLFVGLFEQLGNMRFAAPPVTSILSIWSPAASRPLKGNNHDSEDNHHGQKYVVQCARVRSEWRCSNNLDFKNSLRPKLGQSEKAADTQRFSFFLCGHLWIVSAGQIRFFNKYLLSKVALQRLHYIVLAKNSPLFWKRTVGKEDNSCCCSVFECL